MKQGKQKKSGPKSKITMFLIVVFALMFSTAVVLFGNQMFHQNAVEQSELYDKMYIESAKLESRKTGTGPFNEGSGIPNPGEDYSEDDNYVRTFDVVKYTLSAVIQPNIEAEGVDETSAFNGGVVKLKGRIEDTTYFTWQEDAWMQNVVISADGKEIYAEYIVSEAQLAAPGTQTLTATMKARGTATKEGEKAPTPTFEIWMDGNKPDNISSAKQSIRIKDISDLYVSGKGAFNIQLAKGDINHSGEYNGIKGQYITYGISIGLIQDKEELSDLRGLEYPEGDFSVELDLEYLYKKTNSQNEYQIVNENTENSLGEANGTVIITYGLNNESGNTNYWPTENVRIRGLPAGKINMSHIEMVNDVFLGSVYDSGNLTITQNGKKININFNNFKFNDVFPNRNVGTPTSSIIYSTNEGQFASGCIEMFAPYYNDDAGISYDYTLNVTAKSAEYNSRAYGVQTIVESNNMIDDVKSTDNKLQFPLVKRIPGSFYGEIRLLGSNDEMLHSTHYSGDAYSTIGDTIKIYDMFVSNGDAYEGGFERISVWRSDIFQYKGISSFYTINMGSFPNASLENLIYKYGIYKDNPQEGVITDELIEKADFEDFDWYNTEEEARKYGKVAALYVDDPDVRGYNQRRVLMYILAMNDDEKYIGENPIFRHKLRAYEDKERKSMKKYAYSTYTKTKYDENGTFISNHSPYEYGNNILLIPYHVSVEKTVSDIDSSGKMKKAYDVQDGYINFVITPHLSDNKEAKDSDSIVDVVTLTDILPAGLSYVEGSANKEPKSIERNEDGTTTIVWEYQNWQINHAPDVAQITYKAEIDASLENNASIESSVIIETAKDTSRIASRTSTYGIIISNLAGLQIKKTTETPVVEVNSDLKFNLNMNNSSDNELKNVKVLDILPYNGDENTSKYHGSYTVKSVEVDNGTEIYYTTLSPEELETKGGLTKDANGRLNPASANLGNNVWIKATNGEVAENTTGVILVRSNLLAHSSMKLDYTLSAKGNEPEDQYGSRGSIIAEGFGAVVRSNLAVDTVIKRSLSGMVFEDSNQNGIKDETEKNLMGIEIRLLDENKKEVEDVNGNVVKATTTDGNGYYEFTNLKIGKY
ncbi:MAG: SdrD B-like domain-containing protein, partial [Clostridia bacterium]|nr:SdrD B-like domain-containing protein [Clostridia bacterium]